MTVIVEFWARFREATEVEHRRAATHAALFTWMTKLVVVSLA